MNQLTCQFFSDIAEGVISMIRDESDLGSTRLFQSTIERQEKLIDSDLSVVPPADQEYVASSKIIGTKSQIDRSWIRCELLQKATALEIDRPIGSFELVKDRVH